MSAPSSIWYSPFARRRLNFSGFSDTDRLKRVGILQLYEPNQLRWKCRVGNGDFRSENRNWDFCTKHYLAHCRNSLLCFKTKFHKKEGGAT